MSCRIRKVCIAGVSPPNEESDTGNEQSPESANQNCLGWQIRLRVLIRNGKSFAEDSAVRQIDRMPSRNHLLTCGISDKELCENPTSVVGHRTKFGKQPAPIKKLLPGFQYTVNRHAVPMGLHAQQGRKFGPKACAPQQNQNQGFPIFAQNGCANIFRGLQPEHLSIAIQQEFRRIPPHPERQDRCLAELPPCRFPQMLREVQ